MSADTDPGLDSGTRQMLTELAYLACVTNRTDQARRILAGLEEARPGTREVAVGQALADMTDGQADSAVNTLRPLADAGDGYALAFLGLALKVAGRTSESDAVLARVPATEADAAALAAALR